MWAFLFLTLGLFHLPHSIAGSYVATSFDGEQVVFNLGDMAFVLVSMALVWLMIPGVGLFYSGLLRRKNALSMIFLSMASVSIVSFQVLNVIYSALKASLTICVLLQWFFWGYSLTFSDTGNAYIGDLSTSPLSFFCSIL